MNAPASISVLFAKRDDPCSAYIHLSCESLSITILHYGVITREYEVAPGKNLSLTVSAGQVLTILAYDEEALVGCGIYVVVGDDPSRILVPQTETNQSLDQCASLVVVKAIQRSLNSVFPHQMEVAS